MQGYISTGASSNTILPQIDVEKDDSGFYLFKIKIPGASPFAEHKTFSFLESGVFKSVFGLIERSKLRGIRP